MLYLDVIVVVENYVRELYVIYQSKYVSSDPGENMFLWYIPVSPNEYLLVYIVCFTALLRVDIIL